MDRVYYDADCQFCTSIVRWTERALARRKFAFIPLQSPGVVRLLNVSEEDLLTEMRVRLDDGTVIGGAAAVVEIARRIWWAWPLWAVGRVPGAMVPMRAMYRWVARNRRCLNGVCAVPGRTGSSGSAAAR